MSAQRKPKYKQGFFIPKNPSKYKGDSSKIVYRSGLELKYFNYLDLNTTVLEWASEEFYIPYTIPGETKPHKYYVDFWAKVKNKDGNISEYIVEIKPFDQTKEPKQQKRITQAYKKRWETFFRNKCKWEAAENFAKKNGLKFIILTEKDI